MEKLFRRLIKHDIVNVLLANVIIFFILLLTAEGFMTDINMESILKNASITILIGLAQLVVLALGQFNLALSSTGCFSAMVCMCSFQMWGWGAAEGILLGILVGISLGFIQGLTVAKSGLNPFVVTLAMGSVYIGLATAIFQSRIFNVLPGLLVWFNKAKVYKIPVLIIIALAMVLIIYLVMTQFALGRKMLATGESRKAAMIAGINTSKMLIAAHCISGALAAVAGILAVTRLGSAQLNLGSDWLLMSFAAPVLGGTILSGGKVAVIGTIFGAFLLSMINSGLVLLNVSFYWNQLFLGAILVLAFSIDRLRQRIMLKKI